MEYCKKALELDEACIRETGESCFLPVGRNATPTANERDVAVRLNTLIKMALEDCKDENGKEDPEIFRSIMNKNIR